MSFKFSFSNVRKLISSGLDECPIAKRESHSARAANSHAFAVWHTILPIFTRATYTITHEKKKKKYTILGQVRSFSNSPMVLDGADGVYGWLHPEVSDRRRDTPKDNERNDHLEKSDDESELRLGM